MCLLRSTVILLLASSALAQGASDEDRAILRRIDEARIVASLEFRDIPFADALVVFSDMFDLPLVIDARAAEALAGWGCGTYSFRVQDVPLDEALDRFLDLFDLGYRVEHGLVVIERPCDPPVEYLVARLGPAPPVEDLPALLERLGDLAYESRRDARERLLAAGPAALAPLAALRTSDPEVAAQVASIAATIREGESALAADPVHRSASRLVELAGRVPPEAGDRIRVRLRALLPRVMGDPVAWWAREGWRLRWNPRLDRFADRVGSSVRIARALERELRFLGEDVPIADVAIVLAASSGVPVVADLRSLGALSCPRLRLVDSDVRHGLLALEVSHLDLTWTASCDAIVLSNPEGAGHFPLEPSPGLEALLGPGPVNARFDGRLDEAMAIATAAMSPTLEIAPALAAATVRLDAVDLSPAQVVTLLAALAGGSARVEGDRVVVMAR